MCTTINSLTEIQMTNLIGYARVSTVGQDHASQIDGLKAAGCIEIYSEKISGAAPYEERLELQAALAALTEGDVLIVSKLDRIGRTLAEVITRVTELLERGVNIKSLDGRVDTQALGKMAPLVISMLAACADIERQFILERTNEGRERAMTAGVKFGRKRSYSSDQSALVVRLIGEGQSQRQVAKATGLSATTVRRVLAAA